MHLGGINRPLLIQSLVLCLAVAGCSDVAPTSVISTTTAESPSAAPAATAVMTARTVETKDIRKYLDEGFSDTPWEMYIVKIEPFTEDVVEVDTSLFEGDGGKAVAHYICNGVSGYIFDKTKHSGFTGVRVAARTGKKLVMRSSLSDTCN